MVSSNTEKAAPAETEDRPLKTDRVCTHANVLRAVAVRYLSNAAEDALKSIRRSHLTMAEPCDSASIAMALNYAVQNVLRILEMIPHPPHERIEEAWQRYQCNTKRIDELEAKVIGQEI